MLEIIQPIGRRGLFFDYVEATGGGVHHIAFNVSNWDETVSQMRELGSKMIIGGYYQEKRWCYFRTQGGSIFEFCDGFGICTV